MRLTLSVLHLVARHLYGYKNVLDGDGDPDRPDNYAPQQGDQV